MLTLEKVKRDKFYALYYMLPLIARCVTVGHRPQEILTDPLCFAYHLPVNQYR